MTEKTVTVGDQEVTLRETDDGFEAVAEDGEVEPPMDRVVTEYEYDSGLQVYLGFNRDTNNPLIVYAVGSRGDTYRGVIFMNDLARDVADYST